jgi:hypothetical protein
MKMHLTCTSQKPARSADLLAGFLFLAFRIFSCYASQLSYFPIHTDRITTSHSHKEPAMEQELQNMQLLINTLKEKVPMFARNFIGAIRIYLLSTWAQQFPTNPDNDVEITFLIEISPETFAQHQAQCTSHGIDAITGRALEPNDEMWCTHSTYAIRMRCICNTLSIDEELFACITDALEGLTPRFDLCLLPFGWREDPMITEMIDQREPVFSAKLHNAAPLLFEVKNRRSPDVKIKTGIHAVACIPVYFLSK